MKKIAVLGAHKNALPFYRQLRRFDDYQIVSIAWPEGAVCRELCDTFYPVNFADREKVLEICRKEKIDGITSFALESALPTLTYIVQGMGLVGNGYECLELTSTKYTQRQALERAGIPVPLYWQAVAVRAYARWIPQTNCQQLSTGPRVVQSLAGSLLNSM